MFLEQETKKLHVPNSQNNIITNYGFYQISNNFIALTKTNGFSLDRKYYY